MNYLEKRLNSAVEEWADQTVEELKGQGKSMADRAIRSVADRAQKDFIDKIEDQQFRAAATGTLDKMASVDGLMKAFDAKQSLGLFKSTCGEIGDDIEIFFKGGIDDIELFSRIVDKADDFISKTIEKMATKIAASECGPLAPAVGKFAGYVASKLFREAVSPFMKSALRAKYAKLHYEKVHAFYEEAIAQMQRQREEFIRETSKWLIGQQQIINDGLDRLDSALSLGDVNRASDALNSIAQGVGGQGLTFKSQSEFSEHIRKKKGKLVM